MNVYKNRKEPFFFLVITLGGSFAAIFFAPSALKLFGFSGMSVTEILERPEESAGRALLLYQCIGSLLMFLNCAQFLIRATTGGGGERVTLEKHN